MKKALSLLLTLFCAFGLYAGTLGVASSEATVAAAETATTEDEFIDYAGQAVLNLNGDSKTMELTVKTFVDGDTTHFHADGWSTDNIFKARYAAVNTPESTGKLEPWGKKAAKFTRSKLETATSIIVESDGTNWEADSTGDRYLSWVWYKAPGADTYRNLNLELLQEGLAVGSKAGDSRYGALAVEAINQATQAKLHVYSQEQDPDFFYGSSTEIDLKELRLNIDYYKDKRVAFEGVIAAYENQGVYVESFDDETGMYYGVYVYYGFFLKGGALNILSVGNKVRITGVVQYYEAGDSYQVSDLVYNGYKPTAEDIRLISTGHSASNVETTAAQFAGKVPVTYNKITTEKENEDSEPVTKTEEVTENIKYSELALNTSISMKGLYVKSAYTTNNGGDNDGAMTLTCQSDGKTVTVRTTVLRSPITNELVTQDMLVGKTIDVTGVVDYFSGDYQIKILHVGAIKIDGEPLFPPVVEEPAPDSSISSSDSNEEPAPEADPTIYIIIAAVVVVAAAAVAVVLILKNKKTSPAIQAPQEEPQAEEEHPQDQAEETPVEVEETQTEEASNQSTEENK